MLRFGKGKNIGCHNKAFYLQLSFELKGCYIINMHVVTFLKMMSLVSAQYRLVFPHTLLSCSSHFLRGKGCFTTKQRTVKASLFVK